MPVLEVHATLSGRKYVTHHHKRHYLDNMRKKPVIAYVDNREVIHVPTRKRTTNTNKGRNLYNQDFGISAPKRKKTPLNKLLNNYNYLYNNKYRKHKHPKQNNNPVIKVVKDTVHRNEKEWNHNGPRTLLEKQDVFKHCGAACFMNTTNPDYAVCGKCSKDQCFCYPDCAGLMHVKRLAAHRGDKKVEGAALGLADQLGCDWTNLLKNQFVSKYSKSLRLLNN